MAEDGEDVKEGSRCERSSDFNYVDRGRLGAEKEGDAKIIAPTLALLEYLDAREFKDERSESFPRQLVRKEVLRSSY